MSERGLCWCGLNREMHDGREIDHEGNMHLFNEPVYKPKAAMVFEDSEPHDPPLRKPVTSGGKLSDESFIIILTESKNFLDREIVRMFQNGAKFPKETVSHAIELSGKIEKALTELDSRYRPKEKA